MTLKDHFLTEDYEIMADELENLHLTYMQILNGATKANFFQTEQQLQSIRSSLKTLEKLNQKKLESDNTEWTDLEMRRNWF